ncbi:ATP-binding protein [Mucilaginibacter sp. CSA2-8R]|uniref:ATP-binding protein n=1 Tax=Mucilaginibacter sp. CSA2-8R TaxID=3141542 RepID=UPI00315CD9E2
MRLLRLWPVYFIILFAIHSNLLAASLNNKCTPCAKNGFIDLRRQSFDDILDLDGEWLFNWKQLLSPTQFEVKPSATVEFPALWKNIKVNGRAIPPIGYGTYRLTVLLPHGVSPLKISMPDVYCAYRFYVNGQLAAENGNVTTSPKNFVPRWQINEVDIPAKTDTLRLVLQVANFVHSKGGTNQSVLIGTKKIIELHSFRSNAIDLLLTGCLLMAGLFFLGLYLLGNRDKAILMFALFSIIYSYRIFGTDNYVLHTLLPNLSWYFTIQLEYISLFAGIGLFAFYCHYLYPKDQNSKMVYSVGAICAAFVAATLILSPWYFTQLISPFIVVSVVCICYVPYLYIKAYRNKRPGSVYSLISSFVLMSVFLISILHYWGVLPQTPMINFVGYMAFFFLQSLVLSHRVSFTLKRANSQAAEGLKAKSEFLSTMSHEIRTPLNSVIGLSHLLLKNEPRHDQQEHLNAMIFSANNLLNIVNDILDYSKIEAGKIAFENIEMDIAGLAAAVVKSLQTAAQDKGLDLQLAVDADLKCTVFGDPTRASQVITNLVHNAIKFTLKGQVTLSITVQSQTEHEVSLRIEVKDTGIGISLKNQALIFERFTQADSSTSRGFGGTGLGLSICKRILELQHSSLQLTSKEGAGSNFFFIQSFEKANSIVKPKVVEPKTTSDPKSLAGVQILLAEDNPMNVMVAQAFLKRWGASVEVAVNGQEALDKLDVDRHQLILMDIHMPVMDGYQTANRMRRNGVNTPIIALTATLPSEIGFDLAINGINDMLLKPFLPDELHAKISHHIFKNKTAVGTPLIKQEV